MQGLGKTFDVEETGIESAEPFHVPMLGAMISRRTQLGGAATRSVNVHRAPIELAPRVVGDSRSPRFGIAPVLTGLSIMLLDSRSSPRGPCPHNGAPSRSGAAQRLCRSLGT